MCHNSSKCHCSHEVMLNLTGQISNIQVRHGLQKCCYLSLRHFEFFDLCFF